MTTAIPVGIGAEVRTIMAAPAVHPDAYERGVRHTVPSSQLARTTRVPWKEARLGLKRTIVGVQVEGGGGE